MSYITDTYTCTGSALSPLRMRVAAFPAQVVVRKCWILRRLHAHGHWECDNGARLPSVNYLTIQNALKLSHDNSRQIISQLSTENCQLLSYQLHVQHASLISFTFLGVLNAQTLFIKLSSWVDTVVYSVQSVSSTKHNNFLLHVSYTSRVIANFMCK